MREMKITAALLFILLLFYPLAAQETNFSGKWTLNPEKTKLGEMPEIIIEISYSQLKCSCAFRDGNLIVYYQSRQRRSGKWVILNIEEEHSLSPDGKTLSIVHSERWDDKGGKWPRPMVFDKLTADAEDIQDKKNRSVFSDWRSRPGR